MLNDKAFGGSMGEYLPRTLIFNLGHLKTSTSCYASHTILLDKSLTKF